MADGHQDSQWRTFYEDAWECRRQLLEDWIAAGETDPLRLINRLDRMENKYDLKWIADAQVDFQLIETAPANRLPSGSPLNHLACYRNDGFKVSCYTWSNLPWFLADMIDETGPYDAVVELGCGHGGNLLRLYYAGAAANIPLWGGELTLSGQSMARNLAALNPAIPATFFHFDHLAPDLSPLGKLGRVLVFTCHSIEQVENLPQRFFDVVALAGKHVTCVHLEPFGFQIVVDTPIAKNQAEIFKSRNWNQNLAAASVEAERRGVIKRTFLTHNEFLKQSGNPTSVLIWDNVPQ